MRALRDLRARSIIAFTAAAAFLPGVLPASAQALTVATSAPRGTLAAAYDGKVFHIPA